MRWFIEHQRCILYVSYFITIVLLIADSILSNDSAMHFYLATQAIMVFRVFGVNYFTWVLHVVTMVCLLVVEILLFLQYSENEFIKHNLMIMIIPFAIQFIISLHMVLFRPGHTAAEHACRVGFHAIVGLLLMILYFWICVFLLTTTTTYTIIPMFYLLLFLFISLTPLFQDSTQANMFNKKKRRSNSKKSHSSSSQRMRCSSSHNSPSKSDTDACHCSRGPSEQGRRRDK